VLKHKRNLKQFFLRSVECVYFMCGWNQQHVLKIESSFDQHRRSLLVSIGCQQCIFTLIWNWIPLCPSRSPPGISDNVEPQYSLQKSISPRICVIYLQYFIDDYLILLRDYAAAEVQSEYQNYISLLMLNAVHL
jgi:hypothetical protein